MSVTAPVLSPVAPAVGQRIRVPLPSGQVVDGMVLRVDARTIRLRPDHQHALIVVYR